jgi:hypothetical protein
MTLHIGPLRQRHVEMMSLGTYRADHCKCQAIFRTAKKAKTLPFKRRLFYY